ncbi:membrane protein [Streptomyces viridochromogenes]|nr:membrane protein [Streptomyces viridochromogenes]
MRAALRSTTVVPQVAAVLVVLLLLLVIVRLPWAGDLGMHAATVERLRHDLVHPGNPLVDADTPSPYYSPWMLVLGCVARVTGFSVFVVLRIGAVVGLALLVSGVWRYVRTLSAHRAAPALAVLCLVFLWGTSLFAWSGFLGLNSLALTVSYPSVFALGLAFHLWAWLAGAVREPAAGWGVWLGLGVLWAVISLCHQFSGVVASLGALATVVAARVGRGVWVRLGGGLAAGVVVLGAWPYYDFFALVGAGADLESVHRALYRDLPGRYWLVLLGVVALVLRWRRDRWDPLVLFFVLGAVVVALGGVSGHYSWGRALPAVLIPAQIAAALAAVEGRRAGRVVWPGVPVGRGVWAGVPVGRGVWAGVPVGRAVWAGVLAGALAVGAWTQVGTVGYVVPRGALPEAVAARYRAPWVGYHWVTPWVKYGDVVMARTFAARQLPAYGAYTVAPGYPDFFLPDEGRRVADVRRYFAEGTPEGVRWGIVRAYGVRWVVDRGVEGAGVGLRVVARGPGGDVLYEVVR